MTKVEIEGPPRPHPRLHSPTLQRCGRECTNRARPEFSRVTGGAMAFVYIKKGREKKKKRKRKVGAAEPLRENELASEQNR